MTSLRQRMVEGYARSQSRGQHPQRARLRESISTVPRRRWHPKKFAPDNCISSKSATLAQYPGDA